MKPIRIIKAVRLVVLFVSLSLTLWAHDAIAQGAGMETPVSPACIALSQTALEHVASGRFADAEGVLSAELAGVSDRSQHTCVGLVLHNISVLMAVSGRLPEAEKTAERSCKILSEDFPPDHPVLLRPLQVLAASRFEQGETAKAREAFNRMRLIRIERPQDYALVHGMAAALLHAEGRWQEAEREYLATIGAWEQAGLGGTADAGAIHVALGSLYMEDRRFDDSRRVLDYASTVFASAADTVPMDRIKLLHAQAALSARHGQWGDAEHHLRDALSIADSGAQMDPATSRRILSNYAYVLRRNHHGREARPIEARAAAILVNRKMDAVVDVADFFRNVNRRKK